MTLHGHEAAEQQSGDNDRGERQQQGLEAVRSGGAARSAANFDRHSPMERGAGAAVRAASGSCIFVSLIACGARISALSYCRPVEPIAPSTSHLTPSLKALSVLEISCPAASTWLPLLSFSGPL